MSCSKTFGAASTPIRSSRPAALAVLFLLAGCAGQVRPAAPLPELGAWESRQAILEQRQDWSFTGRLGIKTTDDGFNARLRHTQDGRRFASTLSGPLGIGTLQLSGSAERITLTDKDGQKLVLSDPEADLERLYGWTIPVGSLRYWALGIPDPDQPFDISLDENHRLERLEQRGWTVVIDRYRDYLDQSLPRRITATNPTTRVRMVIDDWSFFDQ